MNEQNTPARLSSLMVHNAANCGVNSMSMRESQSTANEPYTPAVVLPRQTDDTRWSTLAWGAVYS